MPFSSTAPSPASETRSGLRLFSRLTTLACLPGRKLARTRNASAPSLRSRLAGWNWAASMGVAAATALSRASAAMRWRAKRPVGPGPRGDAVGLSELVIVLTPYKQLIARERRSGSHCSKWGRLRLVFGARSASSSISKFESDHAAWSSFVGPSVNDGMAIEVIHGGHDAVLELLFGCDADVAQDRAGELGEEALDEVEPGAVLGREDKFETADRLTGEPSLCLLGDVRGMIVEDQLDCRMGRIGGVEKPEKFDEFAAAVAVLDQGVNLAGQQVDAGQQTDRAVALILMIAREGRVLAGLGRQVRSRRRDRLDAGLLVIGD